RANGENDPRALRLKIGVRALFSGLAGARCSPRSLRSGRARRRLRQPLPHTHGLREPLEHLDRLVPADAAVGDALAVRQRTAAEILAAGDEVALDHHADDPRLARFDLRGDGVDDLRL